jgi:hypothetical protein
MIAPQRTAVQSSTAATPSAEAAASRSCPASSPSASACPRPPGQRLYTGAQSRHVVPMPKTEAQASRDAERVTRRDLAKGLRGRLALPGHHAQLGLNGPPA